MPTKTKAKEPKYANATEKVAAILEADETPNVDAYRHERNLFEKYRYLPAFQYLLEAAAK